MLAIARYDLFSPDLQRALDEVSGETARHLIGTVCSTTIVLDSALYVVGCSDPGPGRAGWLAEAEGIPAAWSLLTRVVVTGEPYVVPDASLGHVRRDNPGTSGNLFRTYAGYPLINQDGHVLGTHCILGHAPHRYTPDELAVLHEGARRSVKLLEEYRADQVALTPNLRVIAHA